MASCARVLDGLRTLCRPAHGIWIVAPPLPAILLILVGMPRRVKQKRQLGKGLCILLDMNIRPLSTYFHKTTRRRLSGRNPALTAPAEFRHQSGPRAPPSARLSRRCLAHAWLCPGLAPGL